jgi:hypothetical protein
MLGQWIRKDFCDMAGFIIAFVVAAVLFMVTIDVLDYTI